MYRLIKRISRSSSSSNGKKYNGYIYIYTQCWYFSYTHVLFTRYYFIVFIINKEELGQRTIINPQERGGDRGQNENLEKLL